MNGRGTISLITVTDSLSNRFANMSFICACLVVCIHIGFAACTRWYEHIAGRIFDLGYMRIAVPFFFVAAGFFAVGHINTKGWYKYAVISRLKSFGVPYLFWNLTYFAFMSVCIYIATLIGYEGVDSGANVLRFTKFNFNILIWATGLGLSSSTPMPFLWFIRCLYFLVLCLPLCVYCAQSLGRGKDLCVLFMIYCTVNVLCPGWAEYFFRGLFYFYVGICFRMGKLKIPRSAILFLLIGFLLTVGCVVISLFKNSGISAILMPIAVLMNLIGVWNIVPDKHWNNFIISSSFPIFVIHIFFYTLSSAVVRIFKIEHIAYYTFIGCIVRFILIIAISLLVVHMLRSLFPRFAAIVFGGR